MGNLFEVAKVADALGKSKFAVQAVAHGVSQGVLSMAQGGKFWVGFGSATLGSLGASGFEAVAGEFSKSAGGVVITGVISGGIGSKFAGGNFWEGAITGGIVAGFNHAMHRIGFNIKARKELVKVGLNPNEIAPNEQESINKILKTETLSKMNTEAGNPEIVYTSEINEKHNAEITGTMNTVYRIKINSRITRNYYELYDVLGHELVHAIDRVSGRRLGLYNRLIERGIDEELAHIYVRYWTERNAYFWNMKYTPTVAGNWKYYQMYEHLVNLLKIE